ncbi:hypothetical protein A2130_04215 [Candidatus Woesebacteria bacterium GWC2_33_12]|uniref:tRNA-dihydrouridine synthase n=1 Tax=Candidatus Woesebacteria bacterium GW2011_GWB1_33_22 TaxID=1618566 RepID=A0A0G0BY85_9BACT|nr:MAG: tRNA-dihydrouridine synthase [Candidatus Woesebacteria bacterium GW2011_GWC2_33_12]KKP41444.1 MAG: tRNA-dihydrouridine synthase [Candidatus Woesebacteria bacterium GW2011_GWA2_33_20]KKP43830.1 MAG: tRNA-dihydrouridine synthase [Candidatus Woesebacteria bacterium GW2011_GWB1_33_22]KKP45400.1 MAG: tRNA-dihydrouridine synthase [Microgenomates group bacterium GW2011_GWC1_33_28]KKP49282.1 MAG: tRNA-dihydrouridine synthase [Candidatus Woesebacteria bacterium GW2011_GWA1_33_33]OGM06680.1 MAG:
MTNFWQKLPKPFTVLAPMEGVTDFAFRETISRYLPRPDVLFTEFTNVDGLNSNGFEKTIKRFKFSKTQKPIIAQVWGTNPKNFFKSAKIIKDLGFDGIDINMGCPDREAVKTGGGAALIKNTKLVKEIINTTRNGAKNLPFSIKTRLGYDRIVTDEWIGFLLEQKIDAISIHLRTAGQKSLGLANWNELKKVVNLRNRISPNTIIIGNGDVKSYQEIIDKHNEFGADGVMIGRGIFSNSWIFDKQNNKHTPQEYKEILIKHLNLYDPSQNYDTLKKFFKMYINNFKGAKELRVKLMATKNVNEALDLLK